MMSERFCKDCVFYVAQRDHEGDCRRFPPAVLPPDKFRPERSVLPQVNEMVWFGEHKPRDCNQEKSDDK